LPGFLIGAANVVPANSRVSIVIRALRRAIISQALVPGTKLPEDAVGESFGVSRTIARAAFTQLAAEGLIELKPNRGATVATPSLAEAHDIFAVRRGLERIVVETLARRFPEAEKAALVAHVEAEERAWADTGAESIHLAGGFHTLLAEATGNGLLARFVGEVVSRCSLILALYGRPHSSECAVTEHREIISALEAGDADKAIQVMDEHLVSVIGRALLDDKPHRPRDIREILSPFAVEAAEPPQRSARRARKGK
jgi:DNA-binding GntR family transcriptional regulator